MAEIRIKKKRSPIWPWLVGILIVLAAVWLMLEFVLTEQGIRFETKIKEKFHIEENNRRSEGNGYQTHTKRIDDFIALVNDETFIEEHIDADKAREGMQLLAEALDEVIDEHGISNQEIIADNHVLSEQVNGSGQDQNEGPAVNETDLNRSFYTAANLIEGIQQEKFPEIYTIVADVKESAMAIEPYKNISEQSEQVKDFLIRSGHALQSMRESIYGRLFHDEIDENVRLIHE
jgi:hypothetical protein